MARRLKNRNLTDLARLGDIDLQPDRSGRALGFGARRISGVDRVEYRRGFGEWGRSRLSMGQQTRGGNDEEGDPHRLSSFSMP